MTGGERNHRTVLEALAAALAAATGHAAGLEAPPVALLWTDPDGQWRPLIPLLQAELPLIYLLGPYQPEARQGPVIWLKCVIERRLPGLSPAEGKVPILYLPEVGRQTLRAGEACPEALQPLIELQFRGAVWHQKNGRDWTLEAFFGSEQGLGLDIAGDNRTREALARALPDLAQQTVSSLKGRRLDAEDFDRLLVGDPVRDLLTWLDRPDRYRAAGDRAHWDSFRAVCQREFEFDPDDDGPEGAAARLVQGGGAWDRVWSRFAEVPQRFPGIPPRLAQVHPTGLFFHAERVPSKNEEDEQALARALDGLASLSHPDACARILALEQQHGPRRSQVWARLGLSPWALALEPLSRLAAGAVHLPAGDRVEALARDYAERGWRCDRAVIDLLALKADPAGQELIEKLIRVLYRPWLEEGARRLQRLVQAVPREVKDRADGYTVPTGTCFLFADGLRFDLAVRLGEILESRDLVARLSHRVAPLPTVTPTAKPLATPIAGAVGGPGSVEDFLPRLVADGRPADALRLREELARRGFQVMEKGETAIPVGEEPRGWAEIGRIDEFGHAMDGRLVSQLEPELEAVAARVEQLLDAGWPQVTVVTDHGWLLLPGGLPKVELPGSVVLSRWARCAAVRGASTPDLPVYPWHWDETVMVVMPPGIGSFVAGKEYAHGGISLQECVVPVLAVQRGAVAARARITDVGWRGMRCRVRAEVNQPGLRLDLRRNRNQAESSVLNQPAFLDPHGAASFVVEDTFEGAAGVLVILDSADKVVASEATTIGEAS